MYKLKTLELTNFRSYKHLLLENIDKLGLTLISGNNGSGKTSLRNAIEYLLVDTTSDDIPLDEFTFNKQGNCTLRCVLTSDTGIIEITKYRDHKKFGNSTVLSVNGNSENFTEMDRRETQKNIFNVLGITKEMLPISSIFSQKSQSFPEAKESDRKKIIYDAENLHKYTEYADKANAKEKELSKLLDACVNKISVIKQDFEQLNASIEENKLNSLRFEEKRLEEISNLEKDKIKRSKEYEEGKKINIDLLEKDKQRLNDKLSTIIKVFDKTVRNYENIKVTICKLPNLEEVTEYLDKLKSDKNKLIVDKLETEKYLSRIGTDTCPILHIVCDSLITKKEEISKELDPKLEDLKFTINRIDLDIDKKEKIIKDIREKQNELQKLHIQIKETKIDVDSWKNKITETDDKIGCILKDDGKGLSDLLYMIDKRIEDTKVKANPYHSSIDDIKKLIVDKQTKISEMSSSIKLYEEDIKYYKFWKAGYGRAGIPNMKSEDFLSSLELETNKILSSISERMYVGISSQSTLKDGKTVSEKIEYKVYHPDKAITDYSSFSGGERQRILVSDIFSFNKLLSKFNFVILDEILEMSLDDRGKEDILKLLKSKTSEIGVIFVISHSKQIKDAFNNVIEIEKINGESVCKGV
uniref:Putative ATPase domain containing protein n=1 Tax=viral metagenome TaxID=1070528 RepID=A0A6M3KIZ5_9ZZZZ